MPSLKDINVINVKMDLNYKVVYVKIFLIFVLILIYKLEYVKNVKMDIFYLGIDVWIKNIKMIDVIY